MTYRFETVDLTITTDAVVLASVHYNVIDSETLVVIHVADERGVMAVPLYGMPYSTIDVQAWVNVEVLKFVV